MVLKNSVMERIIKYSSITGPLLYFNSLVYYFPQMPNCAKARCQYNILYAPKIQIISFFFSEDDSYEPE